MKKFFKLKTLLLASLCPVLLSSCNSKLIKNEPNNSISEEGEYLTRYKLFSYTNNYGLEEEVYIIAKREEGLFLQKGILYLEPNTDYQLTGFYSSSTSFLTNDSSRHGLRSNNFILDENLIAGGLTISETENSTSGITRYMHKLTTGSNECEGIFTVNTGNVYSENVLRVRNQINIEILNDLRFFTNPIVKVGERQIITYGGSNTNYPDYRTATRDFQPDPEKFHYLDKFIVFNNETPEVMDLEKVDIDSDGVADKIDIVPKKSGIGYITVSVDPTKIKFQEDDYYLSQILKYQNFFKVICIDDNDVKSFDNYTFYHSTVLSQDNPGPFNNRSYFGGLKVGDLIKFHLGYSQSTSGYIQVNIDDFYKKNQFKTLGYNEGYDENTLYYDLHYKPQSYQSGQVYEYNFINKKCMNRDHLELFYGEDDYLYGFVLKPGKIILPSYGRENTDTCVALRLYVDQD